VRGVNTIIKGGQKEAKKRRKIHLSQLKPLVAEEE
jgi:hypothetical protein